MFHCLGALHRLSPLFTPCLLNTNSSLRSQHKTSVPQDAYHNHGSWVWFPCSISCRMGLFCFRTHISFPFIMVSGTMEWAHTVLWERTVYISSQLHVQWHHLSSLKSVMEFFHQRNGQMLQIRVHSSPFPQRAGFKHSPAYNGREDLWNFSSPLNCKFHENRDFVYFGLCCIPIICIWHIVCDQRSEFIKVFGNRRSLI